MSNQYHSTTINCTDHIEVPPNYIKTMINFAKHYKDALRTNKYEEVTPLLQHKILELFFGAMHELQQELTDNPLIYTVYHDDNYEEPSTQFTIIIDEDFELDESYDDYSFIHHVKVGNWNGELFISFMVEL